MPASSDIDRRLSRLELPELMATAAKVTGFEFGKRPEHAQAANVSGVRTRLAQFSQRRDSRTMFALDSRYGVTGRLGAWRGGDREVVSACRRVVRAAGIPAKEVAGVDVHAEFGTAGQLVDGEMRVEEPELIQKIAFARRALEGLPVWSSHAKVGLTAEGGLGSLELHWPVVGAEIAKEARILQTIVEGGFQPPEMRGAKPALVEAGIVHSPAIGFYMDVIATVRVIYQPDDPEMGRLATVYLDRHGAMIPLPRDIAPAKPDGKERDVPK